MLFGRELPPEVRRTIRKAANATVNNVRVEVVPGDSPPAEKGDRCRHGGNRWRRTYEPSTKRIEVGVDWILSRPELAGIALLEMFRNPN